MGLNVLWVIPSPLLTIIMKDLRLNLTLGGLGVSIICLLVAIFSLTGGWLVERIGDKKSFAYGLWLMAVGAIYTYAVNNYVDFFISRVLIGIGSGLCLTVSGVITMKWFSDKERPYINTINSLLPYVATVFTFTLAIPLFILLGHSWRMVIVVWGIIVALTAMVWTIWGKEGEVSEENSSKLETGTGWNLYRKVWSNREVRLLSIALACDLWSFQFLSSILPTFYTVELGMNLKLSSQLTAIFPLAGITAGLLCGIWMSRVGLRKPFTYPLHVMIFVGTFIAINGSGFWRILGLAMAGFGNAGWAPALFTMPMEFDDMNPEKVGVAFSIILSIGYLAAFISPWLGGWLAERISIHHTIFLFSVSSLIAAICTFLMKETGPSKNAV
jgi:ACS family D-galactonate transporter-like MFS transporter